MTKTHLTGAAAAAIFALMPAMAIAQNEAVQANVSTSVVTPPEAVAPEPAPTATPSAEPLPPATTGTVVTTAPDVSTPDIVLPPLEGPINPYANSYNELLPLEIEEEERGFDWGLLGLLGLLGLFGMSRSRERVVYVERADTAVHTIREDDLPRPR